MFGLVLLACGTQSDRLDIASFDPLVIAPSQDQAETSNPPPEPDPIIMGDTKQSLVEEEEPPPPLLPKTDFSLKPLSIEIRAPRDSLLGDLVDINTEIVGDPSDIRWDIEPEVDGLRVLDGGRKAVFSNREVGPYVLFVSVADKLGRVAHDKFVVEIIPQPPANPITATNLAKLQADTPIEEYVKAWLATVKSQSRDEEARILVGTFRSQANALRNGTVTGDPLRSLEFASEVAIGPSTYVGWNDFFSMMRGYLVWVQQNVGSIGTPEEYASAWDNFATILEQLSSQGN